MQDLEKEIDFFNASTEGEYNTIPINSFNYIYTELNKLSLHGSILEAGCGTAAFGKKLIERNEKISVIGVDINRKFIERIEKSKIPRYKAFCGNLEDEHLFEARTFDFIIFPYVLHHTPNISKIIKNSSYWLKDNGFIVIIDPNGSNLILRLSYKLRDCLYRFFPKRISKYASVNERCIPVNVFLDSCKRFFRDIVIKDFLIDSKPADRLSFIGILGNIRYLLLKAYYLLHLTQYAGSDLIIIGEKYQKE